MQERLWRSSGTVKLWSNKRRCCSRGWGRHRARWGENAGETVSRRQDVAEIQQPASWVCPGVVALAGCHSDCSARPSDPLLEGLGQSTASPQGRVAGISTSPGPVVSQSPSPLPAQYRSSPPGQGPGHPCRRGSCCARQADPAVPALGWMRRRTEGLKSHLFSFFK